MGSLNLLTPLPQFQHITQFVILFAKYLLKYLYLLLSLLIATSVQPPNIKSHCYYDSLSWGFWLPLLPSSNFRAKVIAWNNMIMSLRSYNISHSFWNKHKPLKQPQTFCGLTSTFFFRLTLDLLSHLLLYL